VVTLTSVKPLRLAHTAIVGATAILRSLLITKPGGRKFADAPAGVLFKNGFVKVANGAIVLHPHAPHHLARHGHPFDFIPGAPHPQLDQFFAEIFADATPWDRAERVALVQEFQGVCMIGEAPKYQRCLVLHGEGGNGKSQVLETARASIPKSGAVSLPPQQWSVRFQIARLVGAVANFVDEIPERDITGGEVFKSVVSGEPVHCERKNEQPFEFRPKAGHIFSANTLPGTVDQSSGFWRRFIVCPFTLNMEKAKFHRPNAAQAIIAAELPAIVAWALEGAARVQRQGKYTEPAESIKLMESWRRDADPVRRFASSCKADPTATTTPKAMYQAYVSWAHTNGFAQLSSTKFMKRLNAAGVTSIHKSTGNVYQWRHS
jgi:putative DNA primase/helicase